MSYFGDLSSTRLQVFAGAIAAMSAFSTDKANQEFELKFTAPAMLLLNVTEPIANKSALYHQLGLNLAAARRAIEQLQGEEAQAVESGGTLGEDVWTAAISTMTNLWTKYKPQELVPGGTAQNPATKDMRKQWNSNVKREELLRESLRRVPPGGCG